MSDLRRLDEACSMLRSRGKSPNFLFIGGGMSHAAYFSSFALFAKGVGISLHGIVYECAPADRPNKFYERHIVGLNDDDYVLMHLSSKGEGTGSGRIGTLISMTESCFVRVRKRAPHCSTLQPEEISGLDDPFFFLYPTTGTIPAYALEFLSTIKGNVVHVVLEEGIGSYLLTLRDWWFLGVERERNRGIRCLKSAFNHMLWPFVKRKQAIAENSMIRVPFTLFDKVGNRLVKNSVSCEYCEIAWAMLADRFHVPKSDYSNTVIIATTNFSDFGASSYELNVLSIAIGLLEKEGFDVVVRPHPSEKDVGRYRALCESLDGHTDLPLEALIAHSVKPPIAILGFMSSSQPIANALWGIPAICLTDVLGEAWAKLSEENSAIRMYDREVQDSRRLFGAFVEFPQGPSELETMISALNR